MAFASAIELSVKVKTPVHKGWMLLSLLPVLHYLKSNGPILGKVMCRGPHFEVVRLSS